MGYTDVTEEGSTTCRCNGLMIEHQTLRREAVDSILGVFSNHASC